MNSKAKKVETSDKPEVRAGVIGAILTLMPVALAAVAHQVLNAMVLEYESAKLAWKAAVARRIQLETDVKQADVDLAVLLAALPVIGASVLGIRRPIPLNTDYTKLDKAVRLNDLVGWIRGEGGPEELKLAERLEEYGDRWVAMQADREEATTKEHEAKVAYGKARIKLVATVRETDQFIRLHAETGSAAQKALTALHRGKGKAKEEPPPAANSDTVASGSDVTPAPDATPIAKPA